MPPDNTSAILSAALVVLASIAASAYPAHTVDYRPDGDATVCGPFEQYMKIETICELQHFRYYTMAWRQLTGTCGEEEVSPQVYTGLYGPEQKDYITPSNGKTQLYIFACAPYGSYQLELTVVYENAEDVLKDEGLRLYWEVEKGLEETHMWGTWNPAEYKDQEKYSLPAGTLVRGIWPLENEADPYMQYMWSGPDFTGDDCGNVDWPGLIFQTIEGAAHQGCFKQNDGVENIILAAGARKDNELMTAELCYGMCGESAYFAVGGAKDCYCGSAMDSNTDQATCDAPCKGNLDTFCGGENAVSVYKRVHVVADEEDDGGVDNGRVDDDRVDDGGVDDDGAGDNGVDADGGDDDGGDNEGLDDGGVNDGGVDDDGVDDDGVDDDGGDDGGIDDGGIDDGGIDTKVRGKAPILRARPLGCFEDSKDERILDGGEMSEPSYMSAELCAEHCQNFPFFGLQYAHECYCGFYQPKERINNHKCNYKCANNGGETCGGYNAMTVFENDENVLVRRRMCFPDSARHRIMGTTFYESAEMTPHLCKNYCPQGTMAYGVQNGNQCFCSYKDNWKNTPPIDAGNCSSPCTGDRQKTCGGRYALDVYEYEMDLNLFSS